MSIPHTQLDADNELRQEAENVLANDPATTDIYITPTTGLMWRTERLGFGWGGMINAHPPACSKAAMERWPHRCKVGLGGGTQRRCPNTNRCYNKFEHRGEEAAYEKCEFLLNTMPPDLIEKWNDLREAGNWIGIKCNWMPKSDEDDDDW